MKSLARRSALRMLPVYLLFVAAFTPAMHAADKYLAYVGTYTRQNSKGIYAYRFDPASGKLDSIGLVAEVKNPSFVAIHPNQKFLYAVSENEGGTVVSYALDSASGKLTELNSVSAKGGGPCHINVDKTGSTVAIANYNTGSVAVFPVGKDGKLGEATGFDQHKGSSANKERQAGPHAHSADFSPDNRFLMTSDLGLDQVLIYRFDPKKSTITANDPAFGKVPPGSGPRHFAFHPSGKFAYVINEISSTLTAFRYDAAKGTLTEIATVSTLPEGTTAEKNSTAELEMHPSGKFLYGSNRGHNSIAVFAVDQKTGGVKLVDNTPTQGGPPRNFALDPTAQYLFAANQDTDTIVLFKINQATGKLTPTGEKVQLDAPVCIRFAKSN